MLKSSDSDWSRWRTNWMISLDPETRFMCAIVVPLDSDEAGASLLIGFSAPLFDPFSCLSRENQEKIYGRLPAENFWHKSSRTCLTESYWKMDEWKSQNMTILSITSTFNSFQPVFHQLNLISCKIHLNFRLLWSFCVRSLENFHCIWKKVTHPEQWTTAIVVILFYTCSCDGQLLLKQQLQITMKLTITLLCNLFQKLNELSLFTW